MRILWRAFTLSSHAGHFYGVFVDYSNKIFYTMLIFSRSYTISSAYYLVVGHALGKTSHLPNRPCVGASLMYYSGVD